jgi:hypothetical protein
VFDMIDARCDHEDFYVVFVSILTGIEFNVVSQITKDKIQLFFKFCNKYFV